MKNYKFIEFVSGPKDRFNTKKCDCEAITCHPLADCPHKARFIVEIFGVRVRLCLECHANATAALEKYNKGMI